MEKTFNGLEVETAILLALELYNELDLGSFGNTCELIKELAKEFENEVYNKKTDDEDEYLRQLHQFIEDVRKREFYTDIQKLK